MRRADDQQAAHVDLGGIQIGQADHPDVFVVYLDDLPAGELPDRALADGFGAQAGDEVVDVRATGRPGEVSARRWRLP